MVAVVLLTGTSNLVAQHGGGGRGNRTRPFICIYDCRDPSSGAADPTQDDLRRFDQLMAVQASPEQSAAFARTRQDTEAAATEFKTFRQLAEKGPAASLPADGASLNQFLSRARAGNQSFLASFSPAQESGLKELITKLTAADGDVGKEMTALHQLLQTPQTPANVAGVTGNLDKALSSFQSEQLEMGREMSILGEEQGLTFHLPQVTTAAEIAGRQITMPAAGEVIRTKVAEGNSLFDLRIVVDLSDLQENITEIFRSRLTSLPRCGEHIEVRQGMLLPESDASRAVLHLHHEHWVCPPGAGSGAGGGLLVAAGDATVEIKLKPSVDANGELHLAPTMDRVEADEVLRDALLTGTLGETLTEQTGKLVLSGMQKGADLGRIMPPSARQAVTMQKAQLQAGGAGQLRLVLDGEMRLPEEQIKAFAAQIKQQLSAQEMAAQ